MERARRFSDVNQWKYCPICGTRFFSSVSARHKRWEVETCPGNPNDREVLVPEEQKKLRKKGPVQRTFYRILWINEDGDTVEVVRASTLRAARALATTDPAGRGWAIEKVKKVDGFEEITEIENGGKAVRSGEEGKA